MNLYRIRDYFQYGRIAAYSGEWESKSVGSCLFFNPKKSSYYYITIISSKDEEKNYRCWISWGKIYKNNKARQIGSYVSAKKELSDIHRYFIKKCQTKIKEKFSVQEVKKLLFSKNQWVLPKKLCTPVWNSKSRFVESSLKKIERDWSYVSDKVTKQWAGRGLRICLGVFLWEFPYPSHNSYTYATLVRGIQMRFLQAFTGFEIYGKIGTP